MNSREIDFEGLEKRGHGWIGERNPWFYRCKLCGGRVLASTWSDHLVAEHWIMYVTHPEPSQLMTDWSDDE